jgi:hypothetical protein
LGGDGPPPYLNQEYNRPESERAEGAFERGRINTDLGPEGGAIATRKKSRSESSGGSKRKTARKKAGRKKAGRKKAGRKKAGRKKAGRKKPARKAARKKSARKVSRKKSARSPSRGEAAPVDRIRAAMAQRRHSLLSH